MRKVYVVVVFRLFHSQVKISKNKQIFNSKLQEKTRDFSTLCRKKNNLFFLSFRLNVKGNKCQQNEFA